MGNSIIDAITTSTVESIYSASGQGSSISGELTEPIYTDSNINVLFSEMIDPTTVTTVGDGSGSFEVYNDTTPGWVTGVISTVDNLTFSFNPTGNLTGGDSYTIYLTSSILGAVSGTPYNGQSFTFVAVAVAVRSNASIYDDACASLTGWTDSDSVGSATTQETFDTQSTFKQVSNATPNSGEQAYTLRDVGSVGARTVFSVDIYPVTLGARADNDRTSIGVYNGSDVLWLNFSNDNVQYIGGAGSWVDTGISVATGEWQEFTADVTWATGAVDFYKAGFLVHQVASSGVWTAIEPDGTVKLLTTGYTTGSITNYWNFVKIGDDLVNI